MKASKLQFCFFFGCSMLTVGAVTFFLINYKMTAIIMMDKYSNIIAGETGDLLSSSGRHVSNGSSQRVFTALRQASA